MHRAYSLLTVKSIDEEQRVSTGSRRRRNRTASATLGHAAANSRCLPLLWQHRADQPVGEVFAAKVTDAGIGSGTIRED
jgi:hypothetical protein